MKLQTFYITKNMQKQRLPSPKKYIIMISRSRNMYTQYTCKIYAELNFSYLSSAWPHPSHFTSLLLILWEAHKPIGSQSESGLYLGIFFTKCLIRFFHKFRQEKFTLRPSDITETWRDQNVTGLCIASILSSYFI